jgi:exosortase
MTAPSVSIGDRRLTITPVLGVTGIAFLLCFTPAIIDLVQAWLNIPDAAHGLLMAPVALWLVWRTGLLPDRRPAAATGVTILLAGVVFYVLGRTAGVATVPRAAFVVSLAGLTVWYGGWRQLIAWWLPFVLLALAVPLPESLIATITLPLQGVAARMGAALIKWRHIPVLLSGNVIRLPGHTLFVSEACSGLRSLTALVSMAILVGALFLRHAVTRVAMLFTAMGLAIVVNGIRVFLTGFLVFFVDPKLGEGFMHLSEGYLLFLISLSILAGLTWFFVRIEHWIWPSDTSAGSLSSSPPE